MKHTYINCTQLFSTLHSSSTAIVSSFTHSLIFNVYCFLSEKKILVIIQKYEANVYDEYVMRENTAVFRCHLPTIMHSYLSVISWLQNDNLIIEESSLNAGTRTELRNCLNCTVFICLVLNTGHKIVIVNSNLFVTSVNREDGFNSYKCQIRNRLTGDIHFSSTSGKLIITGLLRSM